MPQYQGTTSDPDLQCWKQIPSTYLNGRILSEADDDGVLHPVAFYGKNMVPTECNCEIYDKELLAIVRYPEHWRTGLELTDIPIQIFTDHRSLEYFERTKELTRRQARWAEKLADYNFKIICRTGKSNGRADALTRIPNSIPTDKQDVHVKHQDRALLSPECFQGYTHAEDREAEGGGRAAYEQINALTDEDLPLYVRITLDNPDDEDCGRVRDALEKYPTQIFKGVNVRHCSQRHQILFIKITSGPRFTRAPSGTHRGNP